MAGESANTRLEWEVTGIQAVKAITAALERLNRAQRELNATLGRDTKTVTSYTQMLDATRRMKTTLSETAKGARTLKTEITEVAQKTGQANDKAKGLLLSWTSIGRIIVGSLISRGIGRLLRELRQGVEEAIEFEIRVSELRTISQNAQQSFDQWADSVRRLSDEFGRQPLDLLEGAYQALSNQVAEGAEVMSFMEQAQRLSLITTSSVTEAVQALTATINAYNFTVADARYISDVFFKIIELGRLRLSEIANTIGRVEVLGAQLGVSFEELMASLSVLTIQGVRASEAQTWLRNVMLKLIRPTDRMKELFKEWGVESATAAVETFTWAGVIEKLNEEVNKGSDALGEIGEIFNRIRATTGAAGLVQNFEKLKEYLDEIAKAGPTAAKAFDYVRESAGFKLQREFQRISNFFIIDIGRKGVRALYEVGEAFGGLANVVKTATYALAAFATIAGSVLIVSLAKSLWAAGAAMWGFVTAIFTASSATAALQAQVTILGITINAATLGLGLLIAAVGYVAYKVHQAHVQASKSLQQVASEYREDIMPAMEQWAAREAEINADRTRKFVEVANTMKRVYLQAIAAQAAAITRLHKIEKGRLTLEDMLFDLKMKTASAAEKEVLIYNRMKKIQGEINDLLKEGTPEAIEAAKEKYDDLMGVYGQASFLDNKRMMALKKWSTYTDETGRKIVQYRWQEVEGIEKIDKLMQQSVKNLEAALSTYNKENPFTDPVELQRLDDVNAKLKEKAEKIDTTRQRLEDYNESVKQVSAEEAKQLGNILALLSSIEEKRKIPWGSIARAPTAFSSEEDVERWRQQEQAARGFNSALSGAKEAIQDMQERDVFDPDTIASIISLVKTLPAYYKMAGGQVDIEAFKAANQQLQQAGNLLDRLTGEKETLQDNVRQLEAALTIASQLTLAHEDTLKRMQDAGLNTSTNILNASQQTNSALSTTSKTMDTVLAATERKLLQLQQLLLDIEALNKRVREGNYAFGGIATKRYASGGSIGSDSIPALLSPGEFVMNKNASRQYLPQLIAMNSGSARFDTGGEVVNNNIGDINITVKGGDTSEMTVRRIASSLRRELKRGTARLN